MFLSKMHLPTGLTNKKYQNFFVKVHSYEIRI